MWLLFWNHVTFGLLVFDTPSPTFGLIVAAIHINAYFEKRPQIMVYAGCMGERKLI